MEAETDEARNVSVVACRQFSLTSETGQRDDESSTTNLITAAPAPDDMTSTTAVDAADDPKRGPATDHVVLAEAIQQEHNLEFWQAVKLYPAAVGWSMFVSIGVIMLAFDPQLLGNLYATPQFAADFGYEYNGEVPPGKRACPWATPSAKSSAPSSRRIYLINYGTYFFKLAGLPTDKAFDMGIGFLGFFFGGLAAVCYVWAFLRVPED
ncbi:sugar porter family MFS transporter [Apiospora arundinis]|uniref:Sugar porter family MFS transporter n=1 Tax=Apiospora arundinis TaxID=335852 RepID=A0ABR2IG73_9PEZI